MRYLRFFLLSLFLCSFIPCLSYSAVPVDQLVSNAMDEVLMDMGNPFVKVIKQGSWKADSGYRKIFDEAGNFIAGSSDHDARLFINLEGMSKERAKDVWLQFRKRLMKKIDSLARSNNYTSEQIQFIRRSVNLYPPEQLLKGIEQNEQALSNLFGGLGAYPNLLEVGEEGAEGLYTRNTRFIRQGFESKGRVQVAELVMDETTEGMRLVHKATAEAEHKAEGVFQQTVKGQAEGAEYAINEARKAMKENNIDIAKKNIKRAKERLQSARQMAGVKAEGEAIKELDDIERQLSELVDKAFESADDAKGLISSSKKITSQITKKVVPKSMVEVSALESMSGKTNLRSRAFSKGILEGEGKWMTLRQNLHELADDATVKLQQAAYKHWFTALLVFWQLKDLPDKVKKDGAYKAGIEMSANVAGLAYPPFGMLQLLSAVFTITGELLVDWISSYGYEAIVKGQDCMDLLAGIYTLGGREHRIFEKRCEEIRDEQTLACRVYDQHGLRKSLQMGHAFRQEMIPPLLLSLLQCHAANASKHYDDVESKHDEGISQALIGKCLSPIIKSWVEVRQMTVNEIDAYRQALSEGGLAVATNQSSLPVKGSALIVIQDPNTKERIEEQLKPRVKCLGGIHADPKVYVQYIWFINGKEVKRGTKTQEQINFDYAGRYQICVTAQYEWTTLGLPKTSLEDGLSGKASKGGCVAVNVEDKQCAYKYSDWSPCDERTKRQTRRVLSKSPANCIDRDKPLLEQSCQPEPKDAPTCSYEYTDWSECVRATKKQTRSVKAMKPIGCVERQRPALEQGCTPLPSEEDKRNSYFNCLCRCYCGWAGHIGVWYDPEGKSIPQSKSDGPCFGGAGAFGNTRRHFFGGPNDCAKGCWEGVYGKGSYDPNKADKMRLEENKKHKKPLKVKIKPSKNPADFGDIVNLTAETSDGTGGYKWDWGGCAQDAKDSSAKVVNTRSCSSCAATVTVTDQDGDSASDSVTIKCTALKVKLIKESPKENSVPVGGKATFRAEVYSEDKPAQGSFIYIWERNPDAIFGDPKSPVYETKGGNQYRHTATFRKKGMTPVWVNVLKEAEGRKATVGESEQIPIEVSNPELIINYTPKEPFIGQEIKLEVSSRPKMGDDIIGFWWEIPNYWTGTGGKASFKPKDGKPVKVTVHAKTKDGGDEVGVKDVTITAKGYQVSISEPRYLESPPQMWQCDTQLGQAQKCGMVTLKPNQFVTHRDIFFKATIAPNPESPRYKWTVDPSGSCGFPGSGNEIRLNCSNTGTYTVKLEVTNADGAKLGEATQGVSISISQDQINNANKAKDAYEKLQKAKGLINDGKLDEAIVLASEASTLDPKNNEAKTLSQKWTSEKKTVLDQINKTKAFIDKNAIAEADRELSIARKLHPKYPPVQEAERLLKSKKDATAQEDRLKAEKAKQLRAEGEALQKQNKLQEAVSKYKESLKYMPDPALERHVRDIETAIQKPKPTPLPTYPPTTTPPPSTHKGSVIFSNGNISGVYNNPAKPTVFSINKPHVITFIQNYHWNNGSGAAPGTIALRNQSGQVFGPWQAKGSPTQGSRTNLNWEVYPNITLPAGTYTVIDSSPATWAHNSGSQGAGFSKVEGYPSGQ